MRAKWGVTVILVFALSTGLYLYSCRHDEVQKPIIPIHANSQQEGLSLKPSKDQSAVQPSETPVQLTDELKPDVVVSESSRLQRPRRGVRVTRPEERGEDFSGLDSWTLTTHLLNGKDKVAQRKAAKVIGDRAISGELECTEEERDRIDKAVRGYIDQSVTNDANIFTHARDQIHRLWICATPVLLENVGNPNLTKAELAIKSLILMRNEKIVKELIALAKAAKSQQERKMVIFTLKKMREQGKTLIPNRTCMSDEDSAALYEKLVTPFLSEQGE